MIARAAAMDIMLRRACREDIPAMHRVRMAVREKPSNGRTSEEVAITRRLSRSAVHRQCKLCRRVSKLPCRYFFDMRSRRCRYSP